MNKMQCGGDMQRLSPRAIALITITIIVAVTVAIMIWANTPDNRPERSPAESTLLENDFAYSSSKDGLYLSF
jgi:flagellar biosynthesis/type III secretory pathway M-ring protein FliF/YscJ